MSSGSGSNNPNPNRLPALLLLAVALFGPPSVATLTFAHAVTQNPWLTALLIALYEVLVVMLSFVVKVWQKLESPLVDKVVEWLEHRDREVISRNGHNYCQHIIYEHRFLDMKGLSTQMAHSLELDLVFVEVCVDPKAPHQTTASPIALPEALSTGKYEIWDYLSPKSGFNQHLVIIGAPGSGKTTLLKHIALTLVQRHQKQLRKMHRAYIPHLLPIFLFLRDHAQALSKDPAFSLVDAVQAHTRREWQQTVSSEWVMQRLASGSCLVLLDGLDEVADPVTRRLVVEWVQRQMKAYGRNRFLLTSRPHGYRDNPLEGVTVTEVCPFTPEQVEQFVYNWYHANEIKSCGRDDLGVQMSARKGAQDLLQRLYSAPALLAFAVNPLLLTMMATIHRYRSSLPDKRVTLYAEICEVFLGKRQEAHGVAQELTSAQKQRVLQPLAYYLMQQETQTRDISFTEACKVITPSLASVSPTMQPKDFLEITQNISGLLLERDPGIYSFAHLTFQEYLAAVHIKETGLKHLLVARIETAWWHETIRLYCAQSDASAILKACMESDNLSVSALALALDCQREALEIELTVRSQFEIFLAQKAEHPDIEQRQLIAEALLSQRSQAMRRLDEGIYIDVSLITQAEYQFFLDELRTGGCFYQPDHWLISSFLPGLGRSPVLGVRRSDAQEFCAWLNKRDSGTWHYRLPRLGEGEIVNLEAGTGYWIESDENFIWANGSLPLSGDTIRTLLASSCVRDFRDAHQQTRLLNPEKSGHQDLLECLILADNLAKARKLHSDLIQALSSIYQHLHVHEHTLQTELTTAQTSVNRIRVQLATLLKENTVQTRHDKTYSRRIHLEVELNRTREDKAEAEMKLQEARQDLDDVRIALNSARKRRDKEHLQAKLERLSQSRDELGTQLESLCERENQLQSDFERVQQNDHLHTQLERSRQERSRQIHELEGQLSNAREQEKNQQIKLEQFSALVKPFYSTYESFRPCTPIYDWERALPNALRRHHWLDLGPVLASTKDDTFQECLPVINDYIDALMRDFDSNLSHERHSLYMIANDYGVITSDQIELTLDLARELVHISFKESTQKLNQALERYMDAISKKRPLGRDSGLSRLIRLYIRYFAAEIARHLSYWLWKEFPYPSLSQGEQEMHVIDHYLDVCVTFALLEERIEERFPACEGILIVKEITQIENK